MSKTVNLPENYSFDKFKDLYMDFWASGVIKGGTTYREGTMSSVLSTDTSCPECGSERIIHQEGCDTCQNCGWSKCEI
jgi:ribonucleoside-diphosphate reductase alpha chain